ncbi:MAG TPA: 3-phosphoshikimate 1-carboxyvinyltransferase [Blastocatellia bacterium]|nr:3-phosphoshikimate 1-carboxyvinyltransferase [Blastocatellia bacterium]
MREVAMSRSVTVKGPARLSGSLNLPGDKSISHRVAMLTSVASGTSRVTGMASSADCKATIECIRRLGIRVEEEGPELVIHGRGLFGYRPFEQAPHLDAGNSGSTIRMLSGLLAGQRFESEIGGDASLRRRPMGRIIEPLRLMGAHIDGAGGNFPPLVILGRKLRALDYASPVASAQVKTCVLFAALLAEGRSAFSEPAPSRNHTELMLKEFGAPVEFESSGAVSVEGLCELKPVNYNVPGDLSSAAFLIAAATVLPDSELLIRDVNINPTRHAFIDVLSELGAAITKHGVREQHGEKVGDLSVSSRGLASERRGTVLSGPLIPNIIDEIPILAVVATQVKGRVEVRDAKELRVKESDRIQTIVEGIRALGGEIEEFEDGFAIEGPQRLFGGRVESAGDHRIAMALAIAGLIAEGETEIVGADCAGVSFPGFYDSLAMLTPPGTVAPIAEWS